MNYFSNDPLDFPHLFADRPRPLIQYLIPADEVKKASSKASVVLR